MNRTLLVSSVLLLASAFSGCDPATPEAAAGEAPLLLSPRHGRADLRVAVVGAGAAGLTAALTLKDLGYQNITVFEKENRVGGKVNSIQSGALNAELGAVFASPDYEVVLGLADRFGVPYAPYNVPRYILDEQGRKLTAEQFLGSRYTLAQIVAAAQAYAAVLEEFPEINQDGFAYLPHELTMTFTRFAEVYGFTPIAELAKSIIVGFGYSYYEDLPAMYVMKILPWLVKVGPTGIVSPTYYTFPTGFQSLWTAVAAQLDVRLSSTVTKIERGIHKSYVTVNGTTRQEFDVVIIATPLNVVSTFMNLTAIERFYFSKIETSRYFVTLFTAANLPGGETVFVHDTARPAGINHAVAWGNRTPVPPIYVGYQLVDKVISVADVVATLAQDVANLGGGTFGQVLMQKEWDYFPHVSRPALSLFIFEVIEALQGVGGIYYVGSTLSFETVEHTARYAKSMVLEHFPVPRAAN